jgi:hypothetical protein
MVRIFCLEYRLDATVATLKPAKVTSIIYEPSLTVWATYHVTLMLMSSEFALPDATFAAFPTVLLSALLRQCLCALDRSSAEIGIGTWYLGSLVWSSLC